MPSTHRYELFEEIATKQPVVLRAGWSWWAFFAPPLWALTQGLWGAVLGTTAVGLTLALAAVRSGDYFVFLTPWLLLCWWVADDGGRWAVRRATVGRKDLRYICGSDASSRAGAEGEARRSIHIRENFIAAAKIAPPDQVALALAILEEQQ